MFFSGRSEYFKTLLHFQNITQQDENESVENKEDENDASQIVELKDIRPEIFSIIYTFIYTEAAVVKKFRFFSCFISINQSRVFY